jgi:hypothetical protein
VRRVAIAGLVLLALIAGCGEGGPSDQELREAAERREKAEERKAEELASARAEECTEQLGGFLESLEELGSRLEVGLNYDEYFDELGNIQVAYNRLPIDDLHPRCLGRVGVPGEASFQAYLDAGEIWEECFEALTCEEGVDPGVQDEWTSAANKLERATSLGMVEVGAVAVGDEKAAAKLVKQDPQEE